MATQRYGLFGWPVKHSVSPQMQEAGFRAAGIDASYELIEVHPDELSERLAWVKAEGFRGWNTTVPHKPAMMAAADQVEPTAQAAGSVNTVINRDGFLEAHSTDGYGLAMSIRESFDLEISGGAFLFWGAGGAARATSVYFAGRGAAAITIVNRTLSKAEDLARVIRGVAPACRVRVYSPAAAAVKEVLGGVDVVVQATSIGLHADDPIAIPADLLIPGLRIVDMIYRPTRLLRRGAEAGCRVVDGKGMLLHQGVRSFQLWTGLAEPPVEAMRTALHRALEEN